MKQYFIRRTGPNTGQVIENGPFGEEIEATKEMPYSDCRTFILQNQRDLRVYKVAILRKRMGAKRRLLSRILAPDLNRAVIRFAQICDKYTATNDTLQLYTGDWSLLEEYKSGEIKIYF